MKCEDVRDMLSGHLDMELEAPWAERVDDHLLHCNPCRCAFLRLQQASRAFAEIRAARAPESLRARFLEHATTSPALPAQKPTGSQKPTGEPRRLLPQLAAAAAGALVYFACAWGLNSVASPSRASRPTDTPTTAALPDAGLPERGLARHLGEAATYLAHQDHPLAEPTIWAHPPEMRLLAMLLPEVTEHEKEDHR